MESSTVIFSLFVRKKGVLDVSDYFGDNPHWDPGAAG